MLPGRHWLVDIYRHGETVHSFEADGGILADIIWWQHAGITRRYHKYLVRECVLIKGN